MKNINKLLIPFLLIQTLMYATDDEIPDGALRLIKKLTAWEEDLEKKFIATALLLVLINLLTIKV